MEIKLTRKRCRGGRGEGRPFSIDTISFLHFLFVSYAHQRGTRSRNNPLTFANRILLFDLDEITICPCVFPDIFMEMYKLNVNKGEKFNI